MLVQTCILVLAQKLTKEKSSSALPQLRRSSTDSLISDKIRTTQDVPGQSYHLCPCNYRSFDLHFAYSPSWCESGLPNQRYKFLQ